jgi:hypothetical protein
MGNGAQVEGGPPPAEYTVFLTLVRTINPECVLFQSTALKMSNGYPEFCSAS